MNRRTLLLAVAAFTFTMFLIAATLAFFAGSTQASAPTGSITGPAVPNVSSWVDIAAFPAVTYSPTPGAAAPAKLKRAGAAAYPPNGKVYLLGGRNGTDGEDIS